MDHRIALADLVRVFFDRRLPFDLMQKEKDSALCVPAKPAKPTVQVKPWLICVLVNHRDLYRHVKELEIVFSLFDHGSMTAS